MVDGRLALFVYVPFCKIKCTYCDFNAYANLARLMEPYAEAVVREIERSAALAPEGKARPARSIYFGGGTPSLVPAGHVSRIMQAIGRSYAVAPDAEITLEANPGTLDADKLRALRDAGISRLSLGVQAFDDGVLKRLNRGHTVSDALTTFSLARQAGYDNINLDFIFGLPLQTLDDWRATLDRAVALEPEHLSLYALKVEEGTGLKHQIRRGVYSAPDDDLAADMYELAEQALAAAGYEQYEISNWARGKGRWRSRHNLTYWRNEPYLGFGAGAHSCLGGARFWNVLSPAEYVQRMERGEVAEAGREEIDRELEMAETMILGLRLNDGVAFDEFAERYGIDARAKYGARLEELVRLGLLEAWDKNPEGDSKPFGSGVRLTPRGRLLSNEVFWRLLPD